MQLLTAIVAVVIGPLASNVVEAKLFAEGNFFCKLIPYSVENHLSPFITYHGNNTSVPQHFKQLQRTAFHRICTGVGLPTNNFTEPETTEAVGRMVPRSLLFKYMKSLERRELKLTERMIACMKKTTLLSIMRFQTLMDTDYFDEMTSDQSQEYESATSATEANTNTIHYSLDSCIIDELSVVFKVCHDVSVIDFKSFEAREESTEGVSANYSVCNEETSPFVNVYWCKKEAVKMLVHSCFSVSDRENSTKVDEKGCTVNGTQQVIAYLSPTRAASYMGADLQCQIAFCTKDEPCDIESPPKC